MDLDTIGTVLLILFTVPLIMLLWIGVSYLFDDCFCDGGIQRKIKRWVSKKLEGENGKQ